VVRRDALLVSRCRSEFPGRGGAGAGSGQVQKQQQAL